MFVVNAIESWLRDREQANNRAKDLNLLLSLLPGKQTKRQCQTVRAILGRRSGDGLFMIEPISSPKEYKGKNVIELLIHNAHKLGTTRWHTLGQIVERWKATIYYPQSVRYIYRTLHTIHLTKRQKIDLLKDLVIKGEPYYHFFDNNLPYCLLLYKAGADVHATSIYTNINFRRPFYGYPSAIRHPEFVNYLMDRGIVTPLQIVRCYVGQDYDRMDVFKSDWRRVLKQPWISIIDQKTNQLSEWLIYYINTRYRNNPFRILMLFNKFYKWKRLPPITFSLLCDYYSKKEKNAQLRVDLMHNLIKKFIYCNGPSFDFVNARTADGTTLRQKLERAGCTVTLNLINSIYPVIEARKSIKESSETLCVVCMDEKATIVLKSCRHFGLCSVCAPRLDKCPGCRQPYSQDDLLPVFPL